MLKQSWRPCHTSTITTCGFWFPHRCGGMCGENSACTVMMWFLYVWIKWWCHPQTPQGLSLPTWMRQFSFLPGRFDYCTASVPFWTGLDWTVFSSCCPSIIWKVERKYERHPFLFWGGIYKSLKYTSSFSRSYLNLLFRRDCNSFHTITPPDRLHLQLDIGGRVHLQ